MRNHRSRRDASGDSAFGPVSRSERREADLFLDDLFGARPRSATVASPPPARPARASWDRPDLIFDNYAHRGTQGAEALGELADEGWSVVAAPRSEVAFASLRPEDVVVQRAIGDGRLTVVQALDDIDARDLYGPGGLIRDDTLILRQAREGEDVSISEDAPPASDTDTGEVVVHLPLLMAHAASGFVYNLSGPNCVVRWARVPRNFSGALDVVVHFHGYKQHNKMRLGDKASASGLDLRSPGVGAPTLGLIPHGRAFLSEMKNARGERDTDGFTFPAITSRDKLQRFIDAGIGALKDAIGSSDRSITVKRVILTGHSGGGAPLNLIMRSIGGGEGVHAFHYFDATYGGSNVLTAERGWLVGALQRDAQLLQGVTDDAERARVMRERGGSLRILFIDGTGTAATARAADRFIAAKLRQIVPDSGPRAFLRRFYRAQKVANPKAIDHGRVPGTFGGRLLADGGQALDPDARDLVAAPVAEDTPTTTDIAPLDRVRTAIADTLQSFRNIVVSVPAPTGRDVAVQVPYFINKPTSPSLLRGQQRRPELVRNSDLSRLYRALPERARIGKAHVDDVRTFLQGAVAANAVPGQASGLSAAGMKSFLSDMGVGVDCSGFVSQALNAIMAAFNRPERIDKSSAYLRGGARNNPRQFDVVSRPSDLKPGDTMWKKGHIRVVHTVEPQPDGAIHFTTAESSSVDLIGPTAKTWKCPHADRFAAVQVERSGTFRASTEVNVFSRYRPLADVLSGARPTSESEDEPAGAPTPIPSATSSAAPPPPPPTAPATSPSTTSTAPAASPTLTQAQIDRLAAIAFANAADIDTFFSRGGASGFTPWFNTALAGRAPFVGKRMQTTATVRRHFVDFWNQIPLVYDRPRITALDFAGLMCIVINEVSGDFAAHPEICGRGASDARGPHPGLAYAFDRIVGLKASYNTLDFNRRAGDLFNDAEYVRAHGSLSGATRLANHGGDFGNAWNSALYPQADFSTAEDLAINGFIMQADFYKFRGRGVIQTTGRGGYLPVIDYVQRYSGSNTVLNDFKRRWTGLTRTTVATASTNADWDLIFAQTETLARGVALHSGTGAGDYRTMSTQASTLLEAPPKLPPKKPGGAPGIPRGTRGSIYFMGRRISGKYDYSVGRYRDRVIAMLLGMLGL
jgi:hypothetical protein